MHSRLLEFKKNHGHCRVSSRSADRQLARWVVKTRVAYREGRLEGSRREKLVALGFEFERSDKDRRNLQFVSFDEARKFARTLGLSSYDEWFKFVRSPRDGRLPKVPRSPQVVYQNRGWISWADFLGNPDRVERSELAWQRMLERLKTYKMSHGNCEVPKDFHDTELANWVSSHRAFRKRGKLSEKRKRLLDELEFTWDRHEFLWDKWYQELMLFKKDFGHCNVPQQWPSNPGLGRWVHRQRQVKRAGKLSMKQISKLVTLGFE
jgi:Helicase associated domain